MVPRTAARNRQGSRPDRPAVSVILIRENAEQLTGSGCCGKLEGDNATLGGTAPGSHPLFAHARRHQQDLGVLHRAIREFFPPAAGQPGVSVVVVDPRNQLYLTPKLWSDVWTYRPGWGAGLRTAFQLFSLPAVIINGHIVSRRDGPPDPDSVCHRIHRLLHGS